MNKGCGCVLLYLSIMLFHTFSCALTLGSQQCTRKLDQNFVCLTFNTWWGTEETWETSPKKYQHSWSVWIDNNISTWPLESMNQAMDDNPNKYFTHWNQIVHDSYCLISYPLKKNTLVHFLQVRWDSFCSIQQKLWLPPDASGSSFSVSSTTTWRFCENGRRRGNPHIFLCFLKKARQE